MPLHEVCIINNTYIILIISPGDRSNRTSTIASENVFLMWNNKNIQDVFCCEFHNGKVTPDLDRIGRLLTDGSCLVPDKRAAHSARTSEICASGILPGYLFFYSARNCVFVVSQSLYQDDHHYCINPYNSGSQSYIYILSRTRTYCLGVGQKYNKHPSHIYNAPNEVIFQM